ncbi:MAG: hypothetical protein WCT14_05900 [Treponemataceae bacterium]
MTKHLYLSLIPEALIASQLEPEEFGAYYAVGFEKKTQGQAAFFDLDPTFRDPFFSIDAALLRCVPHSDGKPKRSVYISVYRVVEHVPLSAIQRLYLTTKDGRTLGVDRAASIAPDESGLHLYQEIAPLSPLVASTLGPISFHQFLTKKDGPLSVPCLSWTELRLGELASNPELGAIRDLPYENIDHLRSCLAQLKTKTVTTKLVERLHTKGFSYRTLKTGLYYGTREGLALFQMPQTETLQEKHYQWWRSANL